MRYKQAAIGILLSNGARDVLSYGCEQNSQAMRRILVRGTIISKLFEHYDTLLTLTMATLESCAASVIFLSWPPMNRGHLELCDFSEIF